MSAELIQPVLIAVLVVVEVAVWQRRVAVATRGPKHVSDSVPVKRFLDRISVVGKYSSSVYNLCTLRIANDNDTGAGCIAPGPKFVEV